MRPIHLLICCALFVLTCTVWAEGASAADGIQVDHVEKVNHKQAKLAGRANNANETNSANASELNSPYTKENHEKKPLSKEEKQALRRQVNETEIKYPKTN